MDEKTATRMFILTCLLIISIIINVHLAHQMWSASCEILAHEECSNLDLLEPLFVFETFTLQHNVDEVINAYGELSREKNELLHAKEELAEEADELKQQLFTARLYLEWQICPRCHSLSR